LAESDHTSATFFYVLPERDHITQIIHVRSNLPERHHIPTTSFTFGQVRQKVTTSAAHHSHSVKFARTWPHHTDHSRSVKFARTWLHHTRSFTFGQICPKVTTSALLHSRLAKLEESHHISSTSFKFAQVWPKVTTSFKFG
jgi:hypothetical protein